MMAKQSNRLVQRIAHEQQENLTTEQLAEKALRDLKEMSPEEKAKVRKHLDKAFGKQKAENMARKVTHDIEHTAQDSVLAYMLENGIELTLESYLDIAFLGNPPDGIEEDDEFLASVPDVILNGPRWVQ
jgi:hypothetical protein